VALPDFVRDALVAPEHRQKVEQIAAGATWSGNPDGLVFTTEKGLQIRHTNVAKTFHIRARRAGVKRIRPHDMRHTCATLLRSRNVPLQVIQQVLRHTDIRMTQKYAHADPSTTVAAADVMDGMFPSRKAVTG
jgi:integrase